MTNAVACMLRRLWVTSVARSFEYLRDSNSLIKTLLMPLALIIGIGYTFSGPQSPLFKVALVGVPDRAASSEPDAFAKMPLIQFYAETDLAQAIHKVQLQRIDMALVQGTDGRATHYWISRLSRKGLLLERLLRSSERRRPLQGGYVSGAQVRYVDWVIPGIIGLNIAMSSLFGIGTVVMSQRRSGYLKRLGATPLRPFEFLLAQLCSRVCVVVLVNTLILAVCKSMLGVRMEGSYLDLFAVVALGAVTVSALALVVTARTSSEEFGNGLLSLLFTLMTVVSGAFFSIDGAPSALRTAAALSPLTYLLDGMRAVMIEGVSLSRIAPQLQVLAAMCMSFLVIASVAFKWREE
jgi:ABC-2 type transport system permease protein